jgi:hypothetical protein
MGRLYTELRLALSLRERVSEEVAQHIENAL